MTKDDLIQLINDLDYQRLVAYKDKPRVDLGFHSQERAEVIAKALQLYYQTL